MKLQPLIIVVLMALLVGCSSAPVVPTSNTNDNRSLKKQLNAQYSEWKGIPYQLGGATKRGVDCSAFVQLTYKDVLGVNLPRTTRDQARLGTQISPALLTIGDLVFFKTSRYVRHVGIYLGDRMFLHASTSKGVTTSSLDNVYWRKRFWKATRI